MYISDQKLPKIPVKDFRQFLLNFSYMGIDCTVMNFLKNTKSCIRGWIKKTFYEPIDAILLGEMVQNNQKTGLYAVFSHFVAVWAPSYEPKKVDKGSQER
jgi:antirestriction protein ArdC